MQILTRRHVVIMNIQFLFIYSWTQRLMTYSFHGANFSNNKWQGLRKECLQPLKGELRIKRQQDLKVFNGYKIGVKSFVEVDFSISDKVYIFHLQKLAFFAEGSAWTQPTTTHHKLLYSLRTNYYFVYMVSKIYYFYILNVILNVCVSNSTDPLLPVIIYCVMCVIQYSVQLYCSLSSTINNYNL